MKKRYILAVFAVVFGVAMQCVAATPTRLSCEYCDNPVGVEAAMRAMIYGEYPSFDEILSTLKKLESEINALA